MICEGERKRLSVNENFRNKLIEQVQTNHFEVHLKLNAKIQRRLSQNKSKTNSNNRNLALILPQIRDHYPKSNNKFEKESSKKIISNLSFLAKNLSPSASTSMISLKENQLKIKATPKNISNMKEGKAKPTLLKMSQRKELKLTRNMSLKTLNDEKLKEMNTFFEKTIEQSILRFKGIRYEINELTRKHSDDINNQRM